MAVKKCTVVLGGQWGDEGKGKLVDLLAVEADMVCRCQGGNNAGHTVKVGDKTYDFHLLPSGILNDKCTSVMGNGMVIHLSGLFDEIAKNEDKGLTGWADRLKISSRAHVVFDFHQEIDRLIEEEKLKSNSSLGTTKKGIGPTYSSKSARMGIRICDLLGDNTMLEQKITRLRASSGRELTNTIEHEMAIIKSYQDKLRPLVCDTVVLVNKAIARGQCVLVEGANAAMLDLDFGTYPYVTSSNCTVGVVCTGLGVPPANIGNVYGVFKAYTTRVGDGAFPTEQKNEIGDKLQSLGREFGVTTGRKRRCGWFDVMVARYSNMVNAFTSIALTKLDILDEFEEIKIGVAYSVGGEKLESMPADQTTLNIVDVEYETMKGWKGQRTSGIKQFDALPDNAQQYVKRIEELANVYIRWVGTGPSREDMIDRGEQQ